MEMEIKFCEMERKMKFLCGSGNKNGTAFSSGTNVKMEFPFSSGFAWSI
jgi:hypothetical protein